MDTTSDKPFSKEKPSFRMKYMNKRYVITLKYCHTNAIDIARWV